MTTRRRRLGCLLAALLVAAPAAAQEADRAAAAEPAAPPRPAPKPRQARRRARQSGPADGARQTAPAPVPPPRLDAAPVPNRDLEGPRTAEADRARLSPSVIHRRLPGQGMATEGAQNIQEERLFFPAPGARLNVPFSY